MKEARMSPCILVLTTAPDMDSAKALAERLVSQRLAACVTLSAASQSFYWWDNSISKDEERMVFIKTRKELYSDLEKAIKEIHPYEVPEIIALPIDQGSQEYLEWIIKETQ